MPTINSTTDYNRFFLIAANRDLSEKHVNNLKKSIEQNGNLTQISPVLVNEHMQIIDGQHRFQACKELGIPVFYTEQPGLTVNEARAMNIFQKNWETSDYVHSYAAAGNPHYIAYLQLMEEFGFNHNVTLTVVTIANRAAGAPGTGRKFAEAREGTLQIANFELTKDMLSKLAQIRGLVNVDVSRNFYYTLARILGHEDYKHDRFISKLTMYGDSIIKGYTNVRDIQHMIEDLYNHKTMQHNRVRFF